MVFSGLTFQRVVLRAVLALLAGSCLRAQPAELAGTMPEDYLPDLKRILATAMNRSPLVIAPLFEMELRDIYRIRDRAARLPSLRGDLNYGSTEVSESGNSSSRSRDQGFFYNLGMGQALYHWGALKNQTAISRINQLIAAKSFEKAYRELAVLLRQSYLTLIVQQAKLRQGREALRIQGESLAVMRERLALGGVSSAEVAGAELAKREADLEIAKLDADLISARRTFARLAGIGELSEDALPTDIPRPAFSAALATVLTATLLRDHAGSTLEAEIYDLKIQEAMKRYDIAKVGLLPKFNLGAGYSLENNTTVNGNAVGQRAVARQTVNVSANWNIFDGFATRAAKLEAKLAQRSMAARREAELQELLETVQSLERQLKLDAEQLELVEIRRGMAVETRRRAEEEATFGTLPKGDIERARVGILLADAKALEARAALLVRWSQFVALATDDPVLNSLSVRHAREKK
ncbi:TolC family protein [Horticoccus sp. 23ND18S-11]|uniref:TolC family protein n=1 Tax=Horticoccus sp. 23ND18S-11 TaxID=3391832 RepID=UPI0039C8F29C